LQSLLWFRLILDTTATPSDKRRIRSSSPEASPITTEQPGTASGKLAASEKSITYPSKRSRWDTGPPPTGKVVRPRIAILEDIADHEKESTWDLKDWQTAAERDPSIRTRILSVTESQQAEREWNDALNSQSINEAWTIRFHTL
jgi:hypothetical protein